jgi:glycosyltransferase involved in cell wall biosynthesis
MTDNIINKALNACKHATPTPSSIWLIVTVRNAVQYIERCLASISIQNCQSTVKVAICDDASTDGTSELIEKWVESSGTYVHFIKNTDRKFKLRNLIHLLNSAPIKDDDVCCFLDGDDSLIGSNALHTVLSRYETTGCWITYGSYRGYQNDACCCREMTAQEKLKNDYRNMQWVFSHLFTFRYFLWKSIPESYFNFNEEVMYKYAPDQVVNLALLDLAKSSRIQYISTPIYKYNDINELNEHRISATDQSYVDKQTRLLNPVSTPIYPCYDYAIIIPYRKREANLNVTYKSIKESIKISDKRIHVILFEHSETPDAEQFCRDNNIEYIYVPFSDVRNLDKFNRALSFDMSVIYGLPARGYVCHDVDMFIPVNFWELLESNLKTQKVNVLQTYANRCVNNMTQQMTDQLHIGLLDYTDINDIHCIKPKTPGSWGGSFYIDRNTYYAVGGHDPDIFSGYAPEDQCIVFKCTMSENKIGFANDPPIELYHQYHKPTSKTNSELEKMIQTFDFLKENQDKFNLYMIGKSKFMSML